MLNRAALILRPAQPYIDWAASLDHEGLVPDTEGEQTVYLIPEVEQYDEIDDFLEDAFDDFFRMALHAWHTNEPDWPQQRTLKMFREWFRIEVHTMVVDVVAEPLIDDDL